MLLSRQSQQTLAICLPLAALGVSLGIVYPAWGRLGETQKALATKKQELAALRAAPLPSPQAAQAAFPDVEQESSRFVGEITRLAAGSGCEITNLTRSPSDVKAGVARAKRAKVTVRGRFQQARSFLYQLNNSRRVYVVTDLALSSDSGAGQKAAPGLLSITLTVERYVAPAAFLAASTAPNE